MTDSPDTRAIAIDGGGTRCRVALSNNGVVTIIETGSANVSTDFDAGIRAIADGLEALSARSDTPVATLATCPAYVGLAGVTGTEIADRLKTALPFDRIRIEDDRPAALRGALGDKDGVVAHCGTGSFYGAQIAGGMRFSGGWGPVVGDEASAQWIGRVALGVTLEAVDGRAELSALAGTFLEKFGDAPGIVRFAGAATPSEFGALAPMVTASAGTGDPLAVRVMQSGANEIARSLRPIGWTPGLTICLTGGIGPHFAPYLPPDMRSAVIAPVGEPLSGAIALALDLAREPHS